jgi:ribosomal protein S18 acetylase RimI-like enzyme
MVNANIRFRTCEAADLDTLRTIAYRTYDEAFRHMNTPANMDAYLDATFARAKLEEELRNPASTFLFMYSDEKLAGYLKLNEGGAQTDLGDPDGLEVERIYVLRDFQGLGMGRALIEKALELARRKKKSHVWLGVWEKNENAIAFYKRMGFRKTGTHPFVMGTDRQTDHVMRREVTME